MIKKAFLPVALVLLFLGSCATVPRTAGEDEVRQVLNLLSEGSPEVLTAASHDPFLLDGEVLVGKAALSLLWNSLAQAGFRFTNTVITEILPAEPSQAGRFSSSREVAYFFGNHAVPGTTFVRFRSDQGEFLLLLSPAGKNRRPILGWGGPY